jgi:hypothetical protein
MFVLLQISTHGYITSTEQYQKFLTVFRTNNLISVANIDFVKDKSVVILSTEI